MLQLLGRARSTDCSKLEILACLLVALFFAALTVAMLQPVWPLIW